MTDTPSLSDVFAATDKAVAARTSPGAVEAVEAAVTAPSPQQPPPSARYATKASSMWRVLEEQRMHHLELAAEMDVEIAALIAKRDDALRAAEMAAAGMDAMSVLS